ncbi:MAG: VOC family protein [Flavobacteriia bacterium]|uniref:bleomycin resistance protein n=1 Tax=Flagellimonas sp. TaxID=2058762 RepID=UPI0010014B8A|nr:MAG: VOC family protein [Flavobacteriia bacterium]
MENSQMEHLQRASPVLASLDIRKSVAFYQDKMGFNKIGWVDDHYAVIGRDKVELHFWKCDNKIFPENTSCYLYVDNVDDLYAELKEAGVIHPNGPLGDKPWGLREFSALDGDGNLLRFGQKL